MMIMMMMMVVVVVVVMMMMRRRRGGRRRTMNVLALFSYEGFRGESVPQGTSLPLLLGIKAVGRKLHCYLCFLSPAASSLQMGKALYPSLSPPSTPSPALPLLMKSYYFT